MIIHTLKMCILYYVHVSFLFFSFLMGVELRHFPVRLFIRNILGVPSLCNVMLHFYFLNRHEKVALKHIIIRFCLFGGHLGRHLDFMEMPKDVKVSSVKFLK